MATFAFRAVDVAGVSSAGELEATSKVQVTEQLRGRGLIPLDISEKQSPLDLGTLFGRRRKIGMRNLAVFSRQFATLIASGMPMLRSLYALTDQTDDERLQEAVISVRQDVEAGSSVGDAMERHPEAFDQLYRSMVKAGEDSGRLEQALEMVAFQLEKLDALRRQIRSAVAYPILVFAFAIIVMIIVVAFIVPVFVGIFEEIASETPGETSELPILTQITVSISEALTGFWFIILPAFVAGTVGFFRWKRTENGLRQWDRWKLRMPVHIGDVVQKVALARWSRILSGMIASGVPILQAVRIAGDTSGNTVIQESMDTVYDSVKRGGTVAGPIEEEPIFPPMVTHMIAVGEETGELEQMLNKVADFYEAEVDAKVKALTSLIEPALIIFIGVGVGFIVISMYLPIFSLYDKIR